MIVAHRGAGGDLGIIAPENSRAAIRAAILMGVDGVELDVRDTSDGGLVLMHDSNLLRTTGVDSKVDEMTQAQITALPLLTYSGKYKGDFSCETVPTLAEGLELVRDRLFVDLDCKTGRIELVAQTIVELGMVDTVFISVGSIQTAVRAREAVPEIRIQIRPGSLEEIEEGFAMFTRPPEIVEVPWNVAVAGVGPVHERGSKLFTDVFGQDAVALLLGDFTVYSDFYDAGADILQSEFPTFLLMTLNRWDW
jgi:Glycerophosphoryl diester phosphodiesterase family